MEEIRHHPICLKSKELQELAKLRGARFLAVHKSGVLFFLGGGAYDKDYYGILGSDFLEVTSSSINSMTCKSPGLFCSRSFSRVASTLLQVLSKDPAHCKPLRKRQWSGILFGDTRVPNFEQDSILLLRYSILYKEYKLTRFNYQKTLLNLPGLGNFHGMNHENTLLKY